MSATISPSLASSNTPSAERFIIMGGVAIDPWVACDEIFKMDRAATVDWIARGELTSIGQVIGIDLAHGSCRDATVEIAREVMTRWGDDGEALSDWQIEFIEFHLGIGVAVGFGRRAA